MSDYDPPITRSNISMWQVLADLAPVRGVAGTCPPPSPYAAMQAIQGSSGPNESGEAATLKASSATGMVGGEAAALGLRFNKGKLRESLLPVEVLEEMLKILEAGAAKYGDFNWQKGLPYMETYDSLTRHLRAWKKGSDIDPEDACLHIAKVAVNAVFLAYFQLKGRTDLDDRPKK